VCGIAGIISAQVSDVLYQRCREMIDAVQHRGPDGRGVFQKNGVALGHARLAVLDLSENAAQPMLSFSGKSVIVFNGEIYNYRELRKTLESLGQRFHTTSDTEVLLSAYEVWGDGFIEKLNGMFAFALLDLEKSLLLLSRDRIGIKPLYWNVKGREILFGSEIKSILVAQNESLSVDKSGFLEYLSFQNYLSDKTLFLGVHLVPPGTIFTINTNTLAFSSRQYWSAAIVPKFTNSADAMASIDIALNSAIRNQMFADVEVNSFLSGGIDSCAIAVIGSKNAGRIKTFTCGFGLDGVTEVERQFDERRVAEKVSTSIGSEHYETVLNSDDFLARMHDWAWHAEEPRVGSSFPNFCISHLASKFTKVCMSGTGGDELFGGYPWRYQAGLNNRTRDGFIRQYYTFWHRMMTPKDFSFLTRPIASEVHYNSFAMFNERMHEIELRTVSSASPWADAALLFEIETFLQGLLIVEDKASMAHGLEVRVPLLDNELVDVALATPFEFKVGHSSSGFGGHYGNGVSSMSAYSNGKKILRDVLSPYLPPEVTKGRKQGFSPPFETWFRNGLKLWIDTEVFGPSSPISELIDMKVARRLWVEHLNGFSNNRLFIWGMINLTLSINAFCRKR
jgi:asparagine synthase (glutamine-hydrolysing)